MNVAQLCPMWRLLSGSVCFCSQKLPSPFLNIWMPHSFYLLVTLSYPCSLAASWPDKLCVFSNSHFAESTWLAQFSPFRGGCSQSEEPTFGFPMCCDLVTWHMPDFARWASLPCPRYGACFRPIPFFLNSQPRSSLAGSYNHTLGAKCLPHFPRMMPSWVVTMKRQVQTAV